MVISRIKGDPAKRRGILLSRPGRPGLAYSLDLQPLSGEVASQYDLICLDPRFMGRSSDEWAGWAAWRDNKFHLGRTGMQVRANVTTLLRKPVVAGKYRIGSATMPWVLQSALGDESERDLMARNARTPLDAAAGRLITPSDELLGFLARFYEKDPMLSRFAAASLSLHLQRLSSGRRSTGETPSATTEPNAPSP